MSASRCLSAAVAMVFLAVLLSSLLLMAMVILKLLASHWVSVGLATGLLAWVIWADQARP